MKLGGLLGLALLGFAASAGAGQKYVPITIDQDEYQNLVGFENQIPTVYGHPFLSTLERAEAAERALIPLAPTPFIALVLAEPYYRQVLSIEEDTPWKWANPILVRINFLEEQAIIKKQKQEDATSLKYFEDMACLGWYFVSGGCSKDKE